MHCFSQLLLIAVTVSVSPSYCLPAQDKVLVFLPALCRVFVWVSVCHCDHSRGYQVASSITFSAWVSLQRRVLFVWPRDPGPTPPPPRQDAAQAKWGETQCVVCYFILPQDCLCCLCVRGWGGGSSEPLCVDSGSFDMTNLRVSPRHFCVATLFFYLRCTVVQIKETEMTLLWLSTAFTVIAHRGRQAGQLSQCFLRYNSKPAWLSLVL